MSASNYDDFVNLFSSSTVSIQPKESQIPAFHHKIRPTWRKNFKRAFPPDIPRKSYLYRLRKLQEDIVHQFDSTTDYFHLLPPFFDRDTLLEFNYAFLRPSHPTATFNRLLRDIIVEFDSVFPLYPIPPSFELLTDHRHDFQPMLNRLPSGFILPTLAFTTPQLEMEPRHPNPSQYSPSPCNFPFPTVTLLDTRTYIRHPQSLHCDSTSMVSDTPVMALSPGFLLSNATVGPVLTAIAVFISQPPSEPTRTINPKAFSLMLQALRTCNNPTLSRFRLSSMKSFPYPYTPPIVLSSFTSLPVSLDLLRCPYRRVLPLRPGVRSWNREGIG